MTASSRMQDNPARSSLSYSRHRSKYAYMHGGQRPGLAVGMSISGVHNAYDEDEIAGPVGSTGRPKGRPVSRPFVTYTGGGHAAHPGSHETAHSRAAAPGQWRTTPPGQRGPARR
jgi:hypothetical protein